MTTCPFCGFEYDAASSHATCNGCPLGSACSMACCPRCGYKMPAESRLGKLIKRLTGKEDLNGPA